LHFHQFLIAKDIVIVGTYIFADFYEVDWSNLIENHFGVEPGYVYVISMPHVRDHPIRVEKVVSANKGEKETDSTVLETWYINRQLQPEADFDMTKLLDSDAVYSLFYPKLDGDPRWVGVRAIVHPGLPAQHCEDWDQLPYEVDSDPHEWDFDTLEDRILQDTFGRMLLYRDFEDPTTERVYCEGPCWVMPAAIDGRLLNEFENSREAREKMEVDASGQWWFVMPSRMDSYLGYKGGWAPENDMLYYRFNRPGWNQVPSRK
jgi:hypothetical protein